MKKGFTLIELLAVIVILAIIATIATPIVLNIINDVKESATLRNAEYYLDAVEQGIARKSLNIGGSYRPNVCEIQEEGNLLCDDEVTIEVEVNGKKPSGGFIIFEKGKITNISLTIENKEVLENEKGELVINELKSGLYNEEGNVIASWYTLVTKYGMDIERDYSSSNYNTESSSPYYVLTNNIKLSKGVKLVIPNSVTKIGEHAFNKCTALTSVIIGDSVTTIGNFAFDGCTALTSVTISSSVTTVGAFAFRGCASLANVIIPSSVTKIGNGAFGGCTSLSSIEIPDSVTHVGDYAFGAGANLLYNSYGNGKYLGNADNPYVLFIGPDSKEITTYELHKDTKYIFEGAFQNCTNLTSITIPDSVTTIGDSAFKGCTGLTNITIPNSVTYFDNSAFENCTSLTSITIPSGVTSLGVYGFRNCTSLTSIEIPSSVINVASYAFEGCTGLTRITIQDGVTSIYQGAFRGCTGLTSITIPGSIKEIEVQAFQNCTNLESITFEGTVEQWNEINLGTSSFWGDWNDNVPATEVVCSNGTVVLS